MAFTMLRCLLYLHAYCTLAYIKYAPIRCILVVWHEVVIKYVYIITVYLLFSGMKELCSDYEHKLFLFDERSLLVMVLSVERDGVVG